jgi:hypothetical protein
MARSTPKTPTARTTRSSTAAKALLAAGALGALMAAPAGAQLFFADGFETATTCPWSAALPEDQPPGVVCRLASFAPASSFVREGLVAAPTVPEPLTVRLRGPAPADTFVTVESDDPLALAVSGGGVLIAEGFEAAELLVDALAPSPGVTLTASLDTIELTAEVRVLGASEAPVLADLTPEAATIPSGGTITLTVVLDIPAPALGSVVSLLLDPPGAGSLPTEVAVLADQLTAEFDYEDGGTEPKVTITALLDASVQTSLISFW